MPILITGGYAPMGATVVTNEIANAAGAGLYSTCGWHPLSTAAALANLEFGATTGNASLRAWQRKESNPVEPRLVLAVKAGFLH